MTILRVRCYQIKTSPIEEIDKTMKVLDSVAGSADAIAVHCGINDIKFKDRKAVKKSPVKSLRDIVKEHPKRKVVVSQIPPVKDPSLRAK